MNDRLLITTVVATDCGNKLYELFDAIVIFVNVSLLDTVHACGDPPTMQEDAYTNELVFIRFCDVIILRDEPALVWKVGVTVNDIDESEVCIHDILLVSPYVPVNNVM